MITLLLGATSTPGELGMLAAHEGGNWQTWLGAPLVAKIAGVLAACGPSDSAPKLRWMRRDALLRCGMPACPLGQWAFKRVRVASHGESERSSHATAPGDTQDEEPFAAGATEDDSC